jgi:hypothetical protein
MTRFRFYVAGAIVALGATTIQAQENLELGKMWTLERPPLGYLKDEYGFAPTAEWFERLRLASIRFGSGCSSSFVSPKGLIMTNHHCVRDQIAKSQGDNDWVKDGFYAKALEDEVRLAGLTVQQLAHNEDVTARMNEGIVTEDGAAAVTAKRRENEKAILAKAERDFPGTRPQIVTLFQGAIYELYVYKVFDDIRLVCSPHLQAAHFGGDFDNFTYPRYCLDFSFVRAYVDGKPADTSNHYFRWCTSGVSEGELVFVTGNPGTTKRLLTHAQMVYLRDRFHPMVQGMIDARLRIRKELVAKQPELEKSLRTEILSWENTQKAYRGYWDGLLDPTLMTQKEAAEKAFRARIAADSALQEKFGDVWDKLAEIAARRSALEAKVRFQNTGGHPYLALALDLVRARRTTDEAERKKISERAREQAASITAIAPLTRAEFVDHLVRAVEWLSTDDPWRVAVIGDRTPEQIAELIERADIRSPEVLADPWSTPKGDERLPEDSPVTARLRLLAMADAMLPLLEANARETAQLEAMEQAQGVRIGQALFAAYGTTVSPDATLTLRFSDGVVKGYDYNGTLAPWRTTFFGLFARNTEFADHHPFDLPAIWKERRAKLDLTKSMDLVSTNDIIGGNSGSPLVNANLEIVGLIFDGNIEMLPNRYVYRAQTARCVSVHVDGILEALTKVYDADRVVAELTGADK